VTTKIKVDERDWSFGITPEGWGRSMVQVEKPMYGRIRKIHKAKVRWSATDAVSPKGARAMGEALILAAELAEKLQAEFDKARADAAPPRP